MARAEANYTIRATDRTAEAFKSIRRNIKDTAGAMRQFAGVAAAGAAVGIGAFVAKTLENADAQTKFARETGLSTEFVSEYAAVLDLAGASQAGFEKGIRNMQKQVGAVGGASKKTESALAHLGLTLEEVQKMSPEEQFEVITGALETMANDTTRAAIAQALFGGASKDVLKVVDMGSEAVDKYREKVRDMGLSLSQDAGEAAERFNDTMATLGHTIQGAGTKAVLENTDALEKLGEAAALVVETVGELISLFVKAGELIGTGAGMAVMAGGQAAEQLGEHFGGMFGNEEEEQPAKGPEQSGFFGFDARALTALEGIERNTAMPARAG